MKKQTNTIIAIDPGASGGIAVFSNGMLKSAVSMPSSVDEMSEFFIHNKNTYENIIIYIEKVSAWSKGDDDPGKKFGINKMLKNYTELLTVIKISGLRFVEVAPVTWQSTLKLKFKNVDKVPFAKFKTFRKRKYKEFAQNCFPEVKVTLKTSDALCLVQFALVKISNDIGWIRERIQNKEKEKMFK